MKKIGNGFGFKMVQAVLYTLAVAAFLVAGIIFTSRSKDFIGTLFEYRYGVSYESVQGYYINGEYYDGVNMWQDGHEEFCRIACDADKNYTLEILRYNESTSHSVKTVYAFVKDNNSAERLEFSNGVQTVEVSYSAVRNYEWEYFKTVSIIFFSLAGVLAVVDILHFIATFKGRKSKGANVLGIVVNLPFALGTFGLCGLVGCIKGRMYLQFKEAGYATGAPVQAVTAEAVAQSSAQENAGVVSDERDQQNKEQFSTEKRQVKKSDFKLDLYDASIDEKTWKQFKKTASQDELAVIAIGAKYRVAHSRIKNILFAIGIVLSVALFWPTGGFSLIGYPVFAFLSTKSIRYEDTLNQAYKKLNKEYKAFVDGYFNCGIIWTIIDIITKFGIFWLTIPYQAILLLIGAFAPNFVISKNGILVSIPNGYDVGDLGAVGAYYSGFSLIDESIANQSKSSSQTEKTSSPTDDYYKKDEYTYTDSHGYEQTVYSSDGKEFYDAGGRYVGSSDENGGKFKKED